MSWLNCYCEYTLLQLKHCLPNVNAGTQVNITPELSGRIKSSLKSVTDAMHVIHQAATQADRALHLQPGVWLSYYYYMNVILLLCECYVAVIWMLCYCYVNAMLLLCECYVTVMWMLCYCYVNIMLLLCECYVAVMWMLCYCYVNATLLLCECNVTVMWWLCYCYVNAMLLLCDV